MSDTPRTAAAMRDWCRVGPGTGGPVVHASFAAGLERELAETRECLKEAIRFRNTEMSGYDLARWFRAVGIKGPR